MLDTDIVFNIGDKVWTQDNTCGASTSGGQIIIMVHPVIQVARIERDRPHGERQLWAVGS